VFTVIGLSTPDKIMKAYGIGEIKKCQPLSLVHRFGTNGTTVKQEFGAIIPWVARDMKGMEHDFNFRADKLERETTRF
jgi:hypothetical protein